MSEKKFGRGIEDFLGDFLSGSPGPSPTNGRPPDPVDRDAPSREEGSPDLARAFGEPVAPAVAFVPALCFISGAAGEAAIRAIGRLAESLAAEAARVTLLDASLFGYPEASWLRNLPWISSWSLHCEETDLSGGEEPVACRLDLSIAALARDCASSATPSWIDDLEAGSDLLLVHVSYHAPVNARALLEEADLRVLALSREGDIAEDYRSLKAMSRLSGHGGCAVVEVDDPPGAREAGRPGKKERLIRVAERCLGIELIDLGFVHELHRGRMMAAVRRQLEGGERSSGEFGRRSLLRRVIST